LYLKFISRFNIWVSILFCLAIISGLFWLNLNYTYQLSSGGQFAGYWTWSRAFLKDGHSPYTQTTLNRIQRIHTQLGETTVEPVEALIIPLHAVLFLAPFALVDDYPLAQALWLTTLQLCLLILAFYSIHVTGWRVSGWMATLMALFALTWFYGAYALLSGDMVAIAALLVALFYAAMKSGLDELGGFLLALSSAFPFTFILLIVFGVLWGLFQRCWRFLTWFTGSLFLLVFGGVLLLPEWPLQYFEVMRGYILGGSWLSSTTAFTLLSPGVGGRLTLIFSLVFGVLLLREWWLAFNRSEVNRFLWAAFLTLAVGFLVGLPASSSGSVVLLMPLIFIFSIFEMRWNHRGRGLVLGSLVLLLSIPWLIFLRMSETGAPGEALSIMMLPLPIFMIFGLYWVRYWAVKASTLLQKDPNIIGVNR
jgi:hypothetical protein